VTLSAARVIKVAMNVGNIPWVYNEGGTITGFEVELVTEVAKRMGAEIQIENVQFAGIFPGLQAGKWDIAASSIFIRKDRVAMMDFADPYFQSDQGFLTRKDSPIKSFADMKGKTWGAEVGSANDRWLRENMAQYGPYTIKTYDRLDDAIMDVQTGRLDGATSPSPNILYRIRNKPDLILAFRSPTKAMQAVAFRKDDPLCKEFNKIQNDLKKDGTLAAIYKKWFGQDPSPDSPTVKVFTQPYVPEN
jgi:polar amino acid transport system substrate-binding protein